MSIFRNNPVLAREVSVRMRAGRHSRVSKIAFYAIVFGATPFVYYIALRLLLGNASHSASRDFYQAWMVGIETTVAILLTPTLTAGSITLEREKQTWNALLLSRLSWAQIAVGKLVGGLLPAALLFALFLPVNIIAAIQCQASREIVLASHSALFATALLCATLGLFCSWRFRRTQIAMAVTMTIVATLCLGSPLLSLLNIPAMDSDHETFLPHWFNPYYAAARASDFEVRSYPNTLHALTWLPTIATYIGFCLLSSTVMLWTIIKKLPHGAEELTH